MQQVFKSVALLGGVGGGGRRAGSVLGHGEPHHSSIFAARADRGPAVTRRAARRRGAAGHGRTAKSCSGKQPIASRHCGVSRVTRRTASGAD
jgi:hypothetical protein